MRLRYPERATWLVRGVRWFALAIAILGLAAISFAQTGKLLSDDAMNGFSKSHQSKVFFHDGTWWVLAFSETQEEWAIWKYNDSFWSYHASAGSISSSARPDAVLNPTANKLFVLFSKSEDSEFYRFTYANGKWTIDTGFPVVLSTLGETDSKNPLCLVRAKNGELWAFRIYEGVLAAIRSTNSGVNWSSLITVKAGLNSNHGATDARVFSSAGQNYVGVAYAEDDKPGESRFGFLVHRDGNAAANWQDESAALKLIGAENATPNLCLVTDTANNLYLLTQNNGGAASHPRNTLYKRTAAGVWSAFKVNTTLTWTSPALAVKGKEKLYLMGINTATNFGEYKVLSIGQENTAPSATIKPLFKKSGEGFAALSSPLNAVDTTSQLMVCSENTTAGKIWFNQIIVGGSGGGGTPPGGCNPPAAEGPTAIAGTNGGSSVFYKPNQSKVFFHGNTWWLAAADNITGGWFLWKKNGAGWSKTISLSTSGSMRPDCAVDSSNNKLYVLLSSSSSSGSRFLRMSYDQSNAAWALDASFPVTLAGFTHQGENPAVVLRAKNGDIWIFVTRAATLYARRSQDGGLNWSNDLVLKTLNTHTAMCDAVSFTANGVDYIGVGYGEDTDAAARYGFLKHKDGEADNAWSDESNKIAVPLNTYADDHIAMAVSPSNDVYMAVKTNPDDNSSAGIALYKRKPGGAWTTHNVFIGSAETRPALAIDETNDELYVFTTLLGSPRFGRYRKCAFGNEDSLATAVIKDFLKIASDDFHNLSTPPHAVSNCTGLLVAAENNTKSNVWYQLFAIKGSGATKPPVVVSSVVVTPKTKNQTASYKIPITLGAAYGLTGGTSTITITWPSDTQIPASLANTLVTVNGVNAASVTTAPLNRKATVKVPNDLAGGALVNVLFKSGAGIVNPATAGDYTLKVRTSAQTADATSPLYNITESTTTPITLSDIVVTPDTTQRVASYKIPITLGANGALAGGNGTITVTWPSDTQLPETMAKSAVKVNGVSAFAVSVDAALRQAVVTVPNNLANGAAVTLLFNSNAGITNPAPGDYTLHAQTSKQNTGAISPSYNIKALAIPKTGARLASSTKAAYDRSSQSKVFYLDNKWWTIGLDHADNKWYLWYFNGASWVRSILVDERPGSRSDMIVDATAKRLFVLSSQTTNPTFYRFAYAGGNWTQEAQVPLVDFGHGTGANVLTMARAMNNALWIFRINNNVLETQVSKNDGDTWSATIPIKTGLPGVKGQTEAVTFSANGNYVGVFYSLINTSTGKLFGFLKHLDSDINSKWTDETSAIARFGTETPEGSLCAAVTDNGVVYVVTRTNPNGPDGPSNTLYKRSAAGSWTKFIVNIGYDWSSPALAVDETNNRLFVMGIRMASTPNVGEYVVVPFGQESTIVDAFATVFMKNATHNFANLSAPATPVTSATGLLMVAGNTTADDLWFSRIALGLAKAAEAEVVSTSQQEAEIDGFTAASVYPNPFNPSTTIRFAVKEPAHVKLQIFNLRGELVRTLARGEHQRGMHEKLWSGHDNHGNLIASGVYFYRLQIGEQLYRGRMQMIK